MARKITQIVVHHSVTPRSWDKGKTINLIKRVHKDKGLSPPGGVAAYHRIIGGKWSEQTRDENTTGFHAGNFAVNQTSVAVCLTGNFQEHEMNEYQEKQLADTLDEWMAKYNIPRERIFLHREVRQGGTACPGIFITQKAIDAILNDMGDCQKYKDLDKERVAQIKRLQAESRKLTGEVHELQGQLKDVQVEVNKLNNSLNEQQNEIDRKEDVILEQAAEIGRLKGALDDANQTEEENTQSALVRFLRRIFGS